MLNTGVGTQNWIVWSVPAPTAFILPKLAPTTPTPLAVNPTLFNIPKSGSAIPLVGRLSLDWWLDPIAGLSMQNVQFTELIGWNPGAVHVLAQSLQWRNLRLIFDGSPLSVDLTGACTGVALIDRVGTRSSDNKQFGFALTAQSIVVNVADPRPLAANVSYAVIVQHAYLFGMPAADQEPTHTVRAIKIYPTLTVSLIPYGTLPASMAPPDIAADMKMVHAPKVTRDFDPTVNHEGQRLPTASYKPTANNDPKDIIWKPGGVVSYLGCDTNDESRPLPGGKYVPTAPEWDRVFDYIIPGIRNEMIIDAVVYPRGARGKRPRFTIPWSPAMFVGSSIDMTCYREPGQGEYDNIHITPYLGFDDPTTDDPTAATAATNYPWIEAPLAADEAIHLHWRWGSAVPAGAQNVGVSPAEFMGWQDLPAASNSPPPRPNQIAGAPLIPPNQSLRIKVTCGPSAGAVGDNTNDPSSSSPAKMTTDAVTVWYMATAHQPSIGTYSQFFGQGFGLAMHMETLTSFVAEEDNWELLTYNLVKPNYHNFRWNSFGQQRVPNGEPALIPTAVVDDSRGIPLRAEQ
jgi:hypothetical protein